MHAYAAAMRMRMDSVHGATALAGPGNTDVPCYLFMMLHALAICVQQRDASRRVSHLRPHLVDRYPDAPGRHMAEQHPNYRHGLAVWGIIPYPVYLAAQHLPPEPQYENAYWDTKGHTRCEKRSAASAKSKHLRAWQLLRTAEERQEWVSCFGASLCALRCLLTLASPHHSVTRTC